MTLTESLQSWLFLVEVVRKVAVIWQWLFHQRSTGVVPEAH
jgi:hypothetical protein